MEREEKLSPSEIWGNELLGQNSKDGYQQNATALICE